MIAAREASQIQKASPTKVAAQLSSSAIARGRFVMSWLMIPKTLMHFKIEITRSYMAIEIERKFLVRDDSSRGLSVRQEEISDGLIAVANGRKVRVRICDQQSTLAVKSKTEGLANVEFEYEIPRADAEELIAHHCLSAVLAKTRYFVPHAEFTWQIDVYKGILRGVVLAEVELPSETTQLTLPPWVGREVTGDPNYKKLNMVNARA